MKNKSFLISFLFIFFVGIHFTYSQTTETKEVAALIKKKRIYNSKNGFGYRIQLENGLERIVKTTHEKFKIEHPTIKTYIKFESPDWKIQVGDYKTRLEADIALNVIKLKFRAAIVVPR